MNPIPIYEYLCLARQRLFSDLRAVETEAYLAARPPWKRSLGRTLTHTLASEWYYLQRLQQHPVPPYERWPLREENPLLLPELEQHWAVQSTATRQVLATITRWDEPLEYEVTDDDGTPCIVTTTPSGLVTQLLCHEVHHRSQVLGMLWQLGIEAQDLDINILTFDRRRR